MFSDGLLPSENIYTQIEHIAALLDTKAAATPNLHRLNYTGRLKTLKIPVQTITLNQENTMLVSVCPHCKTRHRVKDTQLNVAQGFVVCSKCEGLFQAKDYMREMPDNAKADQLPYAVTDVKLVHSIGPQVRTRKAMTKHEIADVLDNLLPDDGKTTKNAAPARARRGDKAKQENINWTLASFVALTVLIMQLFYLILLR